MRRILTLIITVSCLFNQLHAQLVVNNSFTPQQLVQNTLIGSGVSVSNITFIGAPLQIGRFTNTGNNALGLTSGIVMASGQTDLLSNVATNTGGGTTFGNPGTPGDASLDGISTGGTNDAAVLEFDFVPINDTIKFRYVFASEEYNEFVCSNFNDVFAFFLTGPGFPTPTNIALIPGTNVPVTINSVNIGTPGASAGGGTCNGVNQSLANAGFFVDNPLGSVSIEFDGLTTVLTARAVVVPCQTYHIKLAIADVTDSAFDSGVFLEANSFGTNALNINVDTYLPGNQLVEGCTSGSVTLSLSAPAPAAYSIPVISIGGTATQNTDYTTNLPSVIVIPAGQQSFNFNIVPNADGTVDDNETIQILFQSLTCRVDTLNLTIREAGVLSLAQSDFVICDGVTNTLQFNALAYNDPLTGGTFTWSPTTGLSNPNIRNPVATVSSPATYTVTYSSGNCVQTAQVNITASPYSISFPPQTDQVLCSGGSATLNTNLNTGAPTAAFTNTTATPIPRATTTTPLTTTDIPIVVSGMFPTTISTAAELALINSMCFRINNQLVDHLVVTLISPSGQQIILTQNNGGAGNAYNNSCFTRTATVPISNYNNIPIPANGSFIPQGGAAGWNNFIGSTVNGTWILRINHNGTGTTYNGNFLNATLTLNNINNPVLTWTPPAGLSCTTCASPVATPTVTTTYQVVASNASGCSDTAQVTVFVQSDLPAPQVTCVSSTINSVTFGWAPVPGAASYNISTDGINFVTNGTNTTYTINGLTAGQAATLTVVALAPAGSVCASSQPGTVTCTAGGCPVFTPLITGNTVVCQGGTTVLSGEAGFVSYSWSSGSNVSIASVPAGGVTLTVTDANNCTGTASTTVTSTAPVPVINASATAVCPGETAILTVGQTFASYQWSLGNAPTQSITVSAAGTYSVTVTDASGCSGTDDILFSINPNPQPSITGTSIICAGTSTFLDAGNYALYAWTTPDGTNPTTNPISAGTGGNYVVTVTNANGCTGTASFALSISNNLQPVITGTPAICDGGVSSLDPGTFLQYVWNTPQGVSTTRFIDAQTAGTYTVTVSEANGCTGTASFNLTINPNPIAQIVGDTSICNGATTLLDATNAAAVQYAWTTPNNTFSAATIAANAAGLHVVTITDANGCTGSAARTVVLINGLTPTITPLGNTTICNGSSVGLDAGVYDNYNWSTTATSQIIQADATGVYSVTVQNSNGCIGSASINITELAPIQSTATSTAVSCNGSTDGALNTQTTGGAGNYTYLWSNNATTANISNVAAGTYTLTVTDNLGCTGTASFNITQPPTAVAVLTIRSNATCNGVANGNAIANPSGGTGPYSFAWSNSSNTAATSNLAANTPYTVTVTDSRGCTVSETFTIGEPSAVVLTFSNITPTLCFNSNDGHATVTPSGGTPGYTYQWGSGETGATAVLLAAGNASVTVSDNNGCTFTQSVNIPSPTPIEITLVNTSSPDCNGTATGSATVSANGSTPPYSYSWDLAAGLQLTATATGLPAGVFGITVTDVVGCTSSRQVIVANTNALEGQLTGTPINCHGDSTGTITSVVTGGNAPYTYLWSNNETTANLDDVAAGTYVLTVTDSRGCTLSLSYTMTEPDQLVLSATSLDPACYNSNDGNINLTATGGTLPYQYNINSGTYRLGSNFASLVGGTYQLTVRDANECLDSISVTLTPPAPINASIFPVDSTIEYGDSLQIIVSANGTVTYQWQADTTLSCDTCPAPYANPHISTTYIVTVIDANGCDTTLISRVNVIFNRRVYVPNLFSPNGDGNNDMFYVQGGRGVKEVKAFRVFDRWGELVYQQEGVLPNTPGWDGTFKGKAVGQGVFAWYAEILYDDGLVELIKGDVTVVR